MDRTIIAPWKAEEKELSEKLYQKLQGLMLLYPGTEEFRKCISEDMFLKPNQQAFFQVMHFLFRLHDPVEFKKRFFWPIIDKRAEANFRTSTVEYLKYLNEKHQLQWTNIKSYLVVMPGGMKFITFLLDLITFIVQELTKQREKLVFGDGHVETAKKDSLLNIKRMRKKNEFFKEFASDYIAEIDKQKILIQEKINGVEQEINIISENIGIPVEQLMSDNFIENFEASNKKIFQLKYVDRRMSIQSVEAPLAELRQVVDDFQIKKSKIEYDEKAVCYALTKLRNEQSEKLANNNAKEDITMNAMMNAFNLLKPQIEESLSTYDDVPLSTDFIKTELEALKTTSEETEAELTKFLKMVMSSTNRADATIYTPIRLKPSQTSNNQLISKFVCTPPIRLELPSSSRNSTMRFSLLDDTVTKNFESINNFFLLPPSSKRKQKRPEQTFDPNQSDANSTISKSKIIDPMQLLRTISKDKNKTRQSVQHNLSTLSTKWKERQCLLSNDFEVEPKSPKQQQITPTTQGITTQSPYTPFNSNERTFIQRVLVRSGENSDNSTHKMTKKSALQKVQEAILQFQNLSTSPSGRLEPLITADDIDLFKFQFNDISVLRRPLETSLTYMPEKIPALQNIINNDENVDPNVLNTNTPQKQQNIHPLLIIEDADNEGIDEDFQLFNTSDTVLKDVIM